MAAKQRGLDIAGGTVRRTSSRFCLGVEHGDYNGTELFGVGTDRFIWMGYKANDSGRIRIFSQNFPDGVVEFRPGQVPAPRSASISETWARFPYGVEHVLRSSGFDTSRGFDAVILVIGLGRQESSENPVYIHSFRLSFLSVLSDTHAQPFPKTHMSACVV